MSEWPMGIWWCRRCQARTLFWSKVGDPTKRDADFAECEMCDFSYGKTIDEAAVDEHGRRVRKVLPSLSREVVARGYKEYLDAEVARRQWEGVPLKVPTTVENELRRRRGY